MTRYLPAVAALTLVYALALASFHPLDLLFGAVLSTTLVVASRRFIFDTTPEQRPNILRRAVAFVPFAARIFLDIVAGTWEVTLVTLHLRPLARPGVVAVPVGERSPTGVAVWAIATGLPPGSFFVDVDREKGVALIHLLDASDPEKFRQQQEEFYRRYQSKVFP